jgi:phenylalanyl-tRNA synthetase alpha chain
MLNQEVIKKAGMTCKTAIAAGMGIDRLAMIKYGINDIRYLYTNDFRFSKQFKKGGK